MSDIKFERKPKKNICNKYWDGVCLKSNYLCWVYPKFLCLVCDTISTKEKKKTYIKMIVIVDILESMIVYTETITLKRNNSKTNQNV